MPTPRPDSAPDPGAEQTVARGPGAGEATVRLFPDAEATVRLADKAPAEVRSGAEAASATFLDPRAWGGDEEAVETVTLPGAAAETASEPESATFLDPRSWGGAERTGETATLAEADPKAGETATLPDPHDPADEPGRTVEAATPAEEIPFAPGELRRFGPGVPPRAAAVWHGQTTPEAEQPRRRRVWRWLAPLLVLLLVLAAFLFWRQLRTPALAVTGVSVTTDPAGPGCGGTAVVTASVATNGGTGTLRYRWVRSDGTTSDEIAQDVRSGAHHTDLVLRWTFDGQGSLQATATLELLAPETRTATASFPYHCA
ncbi:hypothetical protein ACFYUY_07630 [Kitasatospora sp. NPDC004745]|uniref:hypothetical protein n=1 Tax=Kitasatospora sp. NPDC004745 TaxID=3364019 RepID=UPI00367E45A8